MSFSGEGSLREDECPLHKHVEWTVGYEPLSQLEHDLRSPVFEVGRQSLRLKVCYYSCGNARLTLYRRGPSVQHSSGSLSRYWAGLKRRDGTYHYLNFTEELDLSEEKVEWCEVEYLAKFYGCDLQRHYLSEDKCLTFFFRLNVESSSMEDQSCSHVDSELFPSKDCMTFLVGDEQFRMHRAILGFRYPSLRAMYRHGTTESRTGLVHIVDCEPDVFRVFLDFVENGGESSEVSEANACALYVLADKYLADDLKEVCLKVVARTVCPERIAEAANLALVYGEDELMEDVALYLVENKGVVETDAWRSFYSDFPCAAYLLLKTAFLFRN